MIRAFDGLTGHNLEAWFFELFKNYLELQYYRSPGQIELQQIDTGQQKGHHLEIDGVLLLNKTCVLLEYTNQASDFRKKVKKFTRNCNLFLNSSLLSQREKFELFGIAEEDLDDFEDVENFKFLFIGTSAIFENENLSRGDFPDFPQIQKELFIFKPTQLEYLRQLTNLINMYAKNDFYASLGFSPDQLGIEDETIHLDYIKAEGKYITSNQEIRADVYLLKISVKDLLEVARVSRYEGIPFILDQGNNENYQRFLIDQKLNNIASTFITNNARKCFPNTVTLVLSSECREDAIKHKLAIPKRYSSIDIIDGQHRLYAYTKNGITEKVREGSEILATAIKFRANRGQKIANYSARVFCEINSNQAKVKNNLIYLIKYDVLGDKDEAAIAGKVLLLCNKGSGALGDIFFTNTLRKRNKLNLPAVPVTTIIDNDLVAFLKGINPETNQLIKDDIFRKVFGNTRGYFFNKKEGELVISTQNLLERYFGFVAKVFKEDWKINSKSYLISAKYISAFIRLLRFILFAKGGSIASTHQVLKDLKEEIDIITMPGLDSPSFPKECASIPSTSHGIGTIYKFFSDTSSFEATE